MTGLLTATQALAAVEAFVAGAVADGDVATIRAGGSILLKMGDGITKGPDVPEAWRRMAIAVGAPARARISFVILSQGQFRHRAVHLFF